MDEVTYNTLRHITVHYDDYEEQLKQVMAYGLASDEDQAEFLLEDFDHRYGTFAADSDSSDPAISAE